MTEKERRVLNEYRESADRGAFAIQRLPGAPALERRGLLEWMGEMWGCQWYRITDAGRKALEA